jgi:hypothetical protein
MPSRRNRSAADRQGVGCKNVDLRRQDILANHATETIPALYTSLGRRRCRREGWVCRVGWSKGQRSVRSGPVVVVHEDGEDTFEGAVSVQNQQPVETLRANGPHTSFGLSESQSVNRSAPSAP